MGVVAVVPVRGRAQGEAFKEKAMTVPSTMTVIGIRAPGGPDVLVPEQRPVPELADGEVLVKVTAAGVNRPDVLVPEQRPVPELADGEVLVKVTAAGVN